MNLKKKLLPSLFKEDPEDSLVEEKAKKSSKSQKRRKKRKNLPNVNPEALLDSKPQNATKSENNSKKRKRNKNSNKTPQNGPNGAKRTKIDINAELSISDARLENYGLNPRQFKRKMRGEKFKKSKN